MGQIKQKVDQRIADSNINPEHVGLALSLVLGGPANLVKSEVIDRIFGDEIAAITDRLKTEGAAYLLNTDAETVENTLANKNLINQSGNETAKQLVDQLEWTKDGVGVASSIILGGAGGAVAGKSNTTKIDGKDVEVSTAGIGSGGNQHYDSSKKEITVDTSKSKKGSKEYEILNNPPANSHIRLDNGKEFKTNSFGLVEELSYVPKLEKVKRDSRQTQVGKLGKDGDVGGHYQACTLNGTCDKFNLFPQNSNFNNSQYKSWEYEIKRNVTKGEITGSITTKVIRLDPSNVRPDKLEIRYILNGKPVTKYFNNESSKK